MTHPEMGSTDARNLGSTAVPATDSCQVLREARALLRDRRLDSVVHWVRHHADASRARSILLELAIDEWDRRHDEGLSFDIEDLCADFGPYKSSVRRQLLAEELLNTHEVTHWAIDFLAPKWPRSGDQFLHFDLLELLGCGTFARVFLASDQSLGQRQVALKLTQDARQEAALLGRLNHPHIVQVHGVFRAAELGLSGICMEFAGRLTLLDLLDLTADARSGRGRAGGIQVFLDGLAGDQRRGKTAGAQEHELSEAVARVGLHLAEALSHAHGLGILHLDLKPSNVLVGFDGQPRLLDFNLSVDLSQPLSRLGGTLAYMPPEVVEQIADTHRQSAQTCCSPRSDLYSLGAMLHELLLGHPPFLDKEESPRDDATADAIRFRALHQASRQADLGAIATERDPLLRIVRRCVAIDPALRPASMDELAAELRRYLSWRGRVARWTSRNRRALGWLSLTACVLCATTLVVAWQRDPADVRWRNAGEAALARGDYQGAQRAFQHALEVRPDDPRLMRSLARSQQRGGDVEGALRTLASCDRIDHDPGGLTELAFYLLLAHDPRQAVIESQRARAAGAKSRAIRNNLGYAYQATGRSENALAALGDAVEEYPDDPTIRMNRGVTLLGHAAKEPDLFKSALTDFEAACRAKPNCGKLHHFAAIACARLVRADAGYSDRAIEHLQLAMRHGLDPQELRKSSDFQYLGAERLEALIAGAMRVHVEQYELPFLIDPVDDQPRQRD